MSASGELIGQLARGGRLDRRASFSLDPEKAREKMRQFQPAVPQEYILLLTPAAILKKARHRVVVGVAPS